MTAYRILNDATAFANGASKGQKRPRKLAGAHLAFIRSLPCLVTGLRPAEPAHVSYADPAWGKRERGKNEKTDDRWTVPLHRSQHDRQHTMSERAYWKLAGIDPLKVAAALYHNTGDDVQAEVILREARRASLNGGKP